MTTKQETNSPVITASIPDHKVSDLRYFFHKRIEYLKWLLNQETSSLWPERSTLTSTLKINIDIYEYHYGPLHAAPDTSLPEESK